MANPKLIVEVAGDSRKLTRTLKQTETQTQAWARRMSAATGSSSLGVLGGKGFLGAAAIGVGIAGLRSIINASRDAEVVLGQTSVAVEDAGLSWSRYSQRVDDAATRISRTSAFDDEDVLRSFSVFVRGQKDVEKSITLAALAADVARARYTDLDTATNLVNKAAIGQIGSLRRLGIQIDSNATATEALALLQEKFGGAAKRYGDSNAGASDKMAVAFENLREKAGERFAAALGSGERRIADITDGVTKAKVETESWTDKLLGIRDALHLPGLDVTSDSVDRYTESVKAADAATRLFQATLDGGLNLNPSGNRSLESPSGAPFGSPGFGGVPGRPVKPLTAQQRREFFDSRISRELDRNQDISTIQGQINDLNRIAAEIQKRIDATKDITRKLNLEDQLVAIKRQKKSLGEQLVADAADRKRQQQQLAAEAKAREQQAAATRLAQRTQRQFRELGLDSSGDAVTPGVANLKKRVSNISKAIEGTKFDTPKLETQLARFRRVLSEGLVPKDVRAKIDAMLREINDAIRVNATTGPLTKTTKLNADRILSGLGLDPAEQRELKARLSQFNSSGTALSGGRQGTVGAFGQPLVVMMQVDGKTVAEASVPHVTRIQQRHARANPQQKRGRPF